MNKCKVFMLIAAINAVAVWVAAKWFKKRELRLWSDYDFYR